MVTKAKKPVKESLPEIKGNKELMKQIHHLASTIQQRHLLASRMGETYDGNRNLYTECGYKSNLTYEDYNNRYKRQDIVKRIIDCFPNATWAEEPEIYETEDREETEFEKAVDAIIKENKIYHYFNRADRLASLGQYSTVVLGFDDSAELDEPVELAKELLYMQPYNELNSAIATFDTDTASKRFGLPQMYDIQIKTGDEVASNGRKVHFSRVLHIVIDPLESDVYGTPVLEAVYNRLQDIEKVVACAAEMFWRNAIPGFGLNAKEGVTLETQDMADLEDEISNYIHSLTRFVRTKGIDVQQLAPQISSPKDVFDCIMVIIAATIGIPVRILLGTEEGRLAGDQDSIHFNERVAERRRLFATPFVLRPFIQKLIDLKIVPEPKGGEFTIKWPDVNSPSEVQIAETAAVVAGAIAKYVQSGGQELIPPFHFLTEVLKMDEQKAEAILKDAMVVAEDAEEKEQEERERQDEQFEKQQAGKLAEIDHVAKVKNKVV